MPYEIKVVGGVEIVVVPCIGPMDYARFRQRFEELLAVPQFAAGAPAVWDLRDADLSSFDFEEMGKLSVYVQGLEQRRATRVAMVVGHDWEQPLMRLWADFLGTRLNQDRLISDSLPEALAGAAEGRDGAARA